MEGSEGEAAFDAYDLNPQRFINEVLNSVDDLLDGAADVCLQEAAAITDSGDPNMERSEELARGVASIRHLIQAGLDKGMDMWEKYCLRCCFTVPEGFVLPKADTSSDGLPLQEMLIDEELDSQLDHLRNKLTVIGKKSVDLREEIHSLENQSTLGHSYHAYVAEVIQLFEQNSADKMFREIGETASKLRVKIEEVEIKRMSNNKRARVASSPGLFARLDDFQEAANLIKNI